VNPYKILFNGIVYDLDASTLAAAKQKVDAVANGYVPCAKLTFHEGGGLHTIFVTAGTPVTFIEPL